MLAQTTRLLSFDASKSDKNAAQRAAGGFESALPACGATGQHWTSLPKVLLYYPSHQLCGRSGRDMAAEMSKRKRGVDDGDGEHRAVKRIRTRPKHNLLEISDEVLLRILSYLPTSDLLRAEG